MVLLKPFFSSFSVSAIDKAQAICLFYVDITVIYVYFVWLPKKVSSGGIVASAVS